jgi:hypothetical protein
MVMVEDGCTGGHRAMRCGKLYTPNFCVAIGKKKRIRNDFSLPVSFD